MAEVLFQHEIDSLIESLASGIINPEDYKVANDGKVKSHDFHRPNKFSREQLRTLDLLHNSYSRILSNFLSAYLRESIRVRLTTIEQLTYEDFVRSIPSPTLLTVFSLEPLKRTAILETSMHYVFPILDLMLGGKPNLPDKFRDLTEIELSLLRKIHTKVLEQYSFAWSDIAEIGTSIEVMETNPKFSQTITPNETVAVITFDTFIGPIKGLINLCIPFIALDPVMPKLTAHYWLSEFSGSDEKEAHHVEQTVSKVKLDVSVVVGEMNISVRDFLELGEGDVIQLNRSINEDMDLYVDNLLRFKVKPGVTGSKLAAQVTTRVEGE